MNPGAREGDCCAKRRLLALFHYTKTSAAIVHDTGCPMPKDPPLFSAPNSGAPLTGAAPFLTWQHLSQGNGQGQITLSYDLLQNETSDDGT
jgi:hypothetical protein